MADGRRGAALDLFRLAAVMLVVANHTSPLVSVSPLWDFWFTRVLARVAVPFFLMVSGYFLAKDQWRRTGVFLKKTCLLYGAAVLLYLAPSFVVIFSAVLWKTPLTKRKLIALVVSLLGCVMVSGIIGGDMTASWAGIGLGVLSGLCYASYTVFAHYGLAHYESYTMLYWTFLVAGLGSVFFADFETLPLAFSGTQGIVGVCGVVIVATVLPYIFYTKGLEGVESGRASIITNIEPVVETLVGVFVFKEALTVWTVLGMACVFGCVILLANGDKKCEEKPVKS